MKTKIKFIHYDEVESTNSALIKMAKEGAQEYTLLVSGRQTCGRGRMGRNWQSDEGGLWMSLLLRPDIPVEHVPIISLVACLAVARTIKGLTGLYAETKWPNDVLINSKKVCGILPESALQGDTIDYLVLGIGINVNQESFPEEIKDKATSIRKQMGASYPVENIMEGFISEFSELYREMNEKGVADIIEEWKDRCPMMGKDIVIQEGNARFRGIMRGVTTEGHLILEKYDGNRVNIFAGEATTVG